MKSEMMETQITHTLRVGSKIEKAINYNNDITYLLRELTECREQTTLSDSERKELQNLRELKDNLIKFSWKNGICVGPTG